MIDQHSIDKVFDASDIVEVVSDFVSLKRRGVNLIGLCPFHNEKTPSFTVSPSKGIYKCFGCGKGGNAVNFIMEHERMSYVESIRYLARKYHIELEEKELSEEELQQKDLRESMLIATAYAAEYFSEQLQQHEEGKAVGMSYFRERAIRPGMIEKFNLGYCPGPKDKFTKAAQAKAYKLDVLVATGLTIQKDNWLADRFNQRVIFPVHDIAGRVIAFGGRTLKTDKKVAKYINSPESEIYHKSRVLYGLFHAKKEITRLDNCFLVEGYTDVIAFHQQGIENVVASSGTSLTTGQIRLIKRFSENITVIYDGDEAGIKASIRGIDLILEEGMNVKVVSLPQGEDPDSFAHSHSASELQEYISKNQKDFIAFKIDLLKEDAQNDPVKRAEMVRSVMRSVASIPDRLKRSVFIKECGLLLNMDEKLLYSETAKIIRGNIKKQQGRQYNEDLLRPLPAPSQQKMLSQASARVYEFELLRLLVKYGNEILFEDEENEEKWNLGQVLVAEINKEKDFLKIESDTLLDVYKLCEKQINEDAVLNPEKLLQHPDPAISSFMADLLSKEYHLSLIWSKKESYVETENNNLQDVLTKAIAALKFFRVRKEIEQCERQLASQLSYEESKKIMFRNSSLKEIERQLATVLGQRTVV